MGEVAEGGNVRSATAAQQTMITVCYRDVKEPETSKNEPKRNPGFAKNQTEPNPFCHGSYSVLPLNEIIIHTFHSKRAFHFA